MTGMNPMPFRSSWGDFPDVIIQAAESVVKKHPEYSGAKAGDIAAALRLVEDTLSVADVEVQLFDRTPIVVAVQAVEGVSVNVIPEVMAVQLAESLGLPFDESIVQINRVGHTGSGGFKRLATPALFSGEVQAGQEYLLVDDFVGQGGTLANLRGHIERNGGRPILAAALTGKPYSAKLALSTETLTQLRTRHGQDLEQWWKDRFGYGFDLLTESEARYLLRTPDADAVRAGILASIQG
jgi:hypothetical protein